LPASFPAETIRIIRSRWTPPKKFNQPANLLEYFGHFEKARMNRMKRVLKTFWFFIFRALERRLSVRNFYRVLQPLAWIRATLKTAFKEKTTFKANNHLSLPEFLRVKWSFRLNQRQRMSICLSNVLDYFPDQLATPKWQVCCRINGLDHVQRAQRNGRPVILVSLHFGPYWLTRAWLRSVGIPMAPLSGGTVENRPDFRRRLDKYIPLPGIPTVFFLDQLRKTPSFLAAGNVLGIMIDNAHVSKQITVPFCEGWTFRMTTGAIRMAIQQNAELIPCVITDEGDWRFRLELGRPVPKEFLDKETDWPRAGKHLLDEMMPHFQAHPEQCEREFILCLQKTPTSSVEKLTP
jgi:lauroyl/myristoyl acyltransferase